MLVLFSQIVGVKVAPLAMKDFLRRVKFVKMFKRGTQLSVLQTANTTFIVSLAGMLKSVATQQLIVIKPFATLGANHILLSRLSPVVNANVKLQVSLIVKHFPTNITRKSYILLVGFDVGEPSFLVHGRKIAQRAFVQKNGIRMNQLRVLLEIQ